MHVKLSVLLPLSILTGIIFISGCTGIDPSTIAKSNSMIKQFLAEHPNAKIVATHFSAEQSRDLIEQIRNNCDNPYINQKEFYRVTITDPDTNFYAVVWIDWKNQTIDCAYKVGSEGNKTIDKPKPKPGCESHSTYKCDSGYLYWYDSCGNRQEKKEYCQNGCSNNKCIECTSHVTYKCSENHVYWFDSCGNKQEKKENCQYGCSNNACLPQPNQSQTCIEGQTRSCGSSNIGICKYGTQTCVNGNWGSCTGSINGTTEICGNQLDDDCDGQIDENCLQQNCTNECTASGLKQCIDNNNYVTCGNYDQDSCLEWSAPINCLNGCSNGACITAGGSCTDDNSCDDGNPCTTDSCIGGTCNHESKAYGTECGENKKCISSVCKECIPHNSYSCFPYSCYVQQGNPNNLYWFDSCGIQQEMKEQCGYTCCDSKCISKTEVECQDTDNGKNYDSVGTTTMKLKSTSYTFESFSDKCDANTGILTEYYCEGNEIKSEQVNCTYGCYQYYGRCDIEKVEAKHIAICKNSVLSHYLYNSGNRPLETSNLKVLTYSGDNNIAGSWDKNIIYPKEFGLFTSNSYQSGTQYVIRYYWNISEQYPYQPLIFPGPYMSNICNEEKIFIDNVVRTGNEVSMIGHVNLNASDIIGNKTFRIKPTVYGMQGALIHQQHQSEIQLNKPVIKFDTGWVYFEPTTGTVTFSVVWTQEDLSNYLYSGYPLFGGYVLMSACEPNCNDFTPTLDNDIKKF